MNASNAISFSDIATYQRCAKKYWFRVINNLQHKVRNDTLFLGDAIHQMLRDFFLALRDNPGTGTLELNACKSALIEAEAEKGQFPEEHDAAIDLIDEAYRIVEYYISKVDFAEWDCHG